jgi:hypothetical protein
MLTGLIVGTLMEQKRTGPATVEEAATITRIMTSPGKGPHIVHVPEDGLAQAFQKIKLRGPHKSVVHPMEDHRIGLL